MAHGHKGQNAAGVSNSDAKHVQNQIQSAPSVYNGMDLQKRIRPVDKDGKRSNEESTELRAIVIVSKIVSLEDKVAVAVGERNEDVSEGEMLGGVTDSRVRLTTSKCNMGIMVAALKANQNTNETNTGMAISKHCNVVVVHPVLLLCFPDPFCVMSIVCMKLRKNSSIILSEFLQVLSTIAPSLIKSYQPEWRVIFQEKSC